MYSDDQFSKLDQLDVCEYCTGEGCYSIPFENLG